MNDSVFICDSSPGSNCFKVTTLSIHDFNCDWGILYAKYCFLMSNPNKVFLLVTLLLVLW